jgi:hypothetical protein
MSAACTLPCVALFMGNVFGGRRRRRRRSHRRRMVRAAIVFLSIALTMIVGLSAISNVIADLRVEAIVKLPAPPPMPIAQPARQPALPGRPVFRHSVVPGGVYATEEVEDAIRRDPIVAAHYSHIISRRLRVDVLPQDRIVYMSYRVGNDIFWTKKAVRLQKGETILTDGVNSIRARCGNCIAYAPMTPTADDEPGEMEFDALTEDPGAQPPPSLGAESLPPITGFPPTWLVDGPSEPVDPSDVGGREWIDIPVFGYVPDLTELQPPSDVLESLGPDTTPLNFVTGQPLPDSYLPPSFWVPQDPGDPGSPFVSGDPRNPGDPGGPDDPGDPGSPSDPRVPTTENPVVPAPEPATFLLVGGGLAKLIASRLRRR